MMKDHRLHQYYFLLLMVVVTATQICTDVNMLHQVQRGVRVTSPYFLRTVTSGLITCAVECLLRSRCRAFSHGSGECTLLPYNSSSSDFKTNSDTTSVFSDIGHWPQRVIGVCASHDCPPNARCQENSKVDHKCIITGCLNHPGIDNATLAATANPLAETPSGSVMNYTCDPGFLQEGSTVTCLPNGTWSSVRCRPAPSSCADVKQKGISSTDGEFWLYLGENQRARIYCYNMASTNPQEFLTLAKPNSGYYPDIQNNLCAGETPLTDVEKRMFAGTRTFRKIRIDIQNLTVVVKDTTFADGTTKLKPYGGAYDCYGEQPKEACPSKGTFSIDLSGTGFQLNPSQTWIAIGWRASQTVDWVDAWRVNLRCGGSCGGCEPEGSMKIKLNESEATIVD
ncbi:A disintegrin and metalloproteinase with thrombospondin motifs 20-like [Haliotis cracherodii]|uniref:A disintegrin and metalloproteinase with thrombospondin motifs 20-like n=1 Tax=Haliotis cracherodii TaxID=6455 RepID=UPI0039EBA91F